MVAAPHKYDSGIVNRGKLANGDLMKANVRGIVEPYTFGVHRIGESVQNDGVAVATFGTKGYFIDLRGTAYGIDKRVSL